MQAGAPGADTHAGGAQRAASAPAPWEERTIPRVALAAAARYGDASAVEDEGWQLSFRDLADRALGVAAAFLHRGLVPGDRVAIWAPNLPEWILAALGLQMAGGVLVPLNTRFKAPEAGYVLRRSRARWLVTVGEFLDQNYADALDGEELPDLEEVVRLRGRSKRGIPFETFVREGEGVSEQDALARARAVSPDDLSDLMFTSGTTGHPKGVMTCHGQTVRGYAIWTDLVGLRQGDRYLVVNPFFHAFGYKAGWLSCLLRGATALPHAVFDVPKVLERMAAERITVLPGPPTLYQSLLAHPDRSGFDLSGLRLAVTGAAAIPVELVRRMEDELGFETVLTGYGLTECCGIVSMCRDDDDPKTIATTAGRALPEVEVRCVDEAGEEVPRGEPGEVVVRGWNVMQGYFEAPEETAKTIDAGGWLHTGDVGVMDERGYLRITDRIKDMFIMGGFNCYPAEIENLMYRHEGIGQVAVIGVPDARMGEVGMAFVVPRPGHTLEPDAVIAWCRENMANYKVPRRVEIVEALPTNAAGKVTKFALRERAAAGADGAA